MEGEINYTRTFVVWAVLALAATWLFTSHNKKHAKTGFGPKGFFDAVIAAVVASGLLALVYFVYFEYIPHSSPSSCRVDGEACGVEKGY